MNVRELSSVFLILPSASDINPTDDQQMSEPKKKGGKENLKRLSPPWMPFSFFVSLQLGGT